jgi:hypothetical protein
VDLAKNGEGRPVQCTAKAVDVPFGQRHESTHIGCRRWIVVLIQRWASVVWLLLCVGIDVDAVGSTNRAAGTSAFGMSLMDGVSG